MSQDGDSPDDQWLGDWGFRADPLGFRLTIITGACRSGKTTLGQLLGSMVGVDHVEEPWLPLMLPAFQHAGLVGRRQAQLLLRASMHELQNHVALLRGANLRPTDTSSVWKTKSAEEIFDRLHTLRSREDVRRYNAERDAMLLVNVAETGAFVRFFAEAFPEARFIHVVRDGRDVVPDMMEKLWWSDEQLQRPLNNQVYRRYAHTDGRILHMPWWLPEDRFARFVDATGWGRAVMYWTYVMRSSADEVAAFGEESPGALLEVRYDELTADPDEVLRRLRAHLDVEPTPRTPEIAREIAGREHAEFRAPTDDPLPAEELERFEEMRARFQF